MKKPVPNPRDIEAEKFKHSDGCTEGCHQCFKAGWDTRDKLGEEEISRLKYIAERDLLKMQAQSKIISELDHVLKLVVEGLENIRLENERFAKDAIMDWDAVQTIAYTALAEIRNLRSKK